MSTLAEMFNLIKPKTQDADSFLYFDSNGLIYDPSNSVRLFVKETGNRIPSMTKISDIQSLLSVSSASEDMNFENYNFDIPDLQICEMQESAVQVLNALSSYGNTLFYNANIECNNNQITILCAGLQYFMVHKSLCLMPNFSINIDLQNWNIIYYLYQFIKENKVKKSTYYNINCTFDNDSLWINTGSMHASIRTCFENKDGIYNAIVTKSENIGLKYFGKFDRKYINDKEKDVKLKHLLKAFIDDIDVYECENLKHFKDKTTSLFFI